MTTQELTYLPMMEASLDMVVAIEESAHSHPWTLGKFLGSLQAGHQGLLLMRGTVLLGYALLMSLPDEVELLNITIAPAHQRHGFGAQLLEYFCQQQKLAGVKRMYLEVRASNEAARALYEHSGFVEIGRRRGYYPVTGGREDAIVMAKEFE